MSEKNGQLDNPVYNGVNADMILDKRIEEAHDIIHRVAAILAMEEGRDDESLAYVPWNGNLAGATIELREDEEES